MRFVRFDGNRLGLLTDDGAGIIDPTDRLDIDSHDPLLTDIKGDFDASEYMSADPDVARDEVELGAPIHRSDKVIAAPLNYGKHIEEVPADTDISTDQ